MKLPRSLHSSIQCPPVALLGQNIIPNPNPGHRCRHVSGMSCGHALSFYRPSNSLTCCCSVVAMLLTAPLALPRALWHLMGHNSLLQIRQLPLRSPTPTWCSTPCQHSTKSTRHWTHGRDSKSSLGGTMRQLLTISRRRSTARITQALSSSPQLHRGTTSGSETRAAAH